MVLWEGTLEGLDWTPGTSNSVAVPFTPPAGLGELALTLDIQFTSRPSSHTSSWMVSLDP